MNSLDFFFGRNYEDEIGNSLKMGLSGLGNLGR